MTRWPIAIIVLLPVLIAGCLWSSDTPELLEPPDGLSVEAFESQALEVPEQGRLKVAFNTPAIAFSAVSIRIQGVGGTAKIEVAHLSGQPVSLPPPLGPRHVSVHRDRLREPGRGRHRVGHNRLQRQQPVVGLEGLPRRGHRPPEIHGWLAISALEPDQSRR